MKKTVAALAVLVLGGSMAAVQTASAQSPPGRGQQLEKMAVLLDLTEPQKQQLQQVFDEQRTQMQALRQKEQASGTKPTREEMRATHEQLHQQLLSKVQGILQPEQFKKFQVLTEHEHFGRRGPPGPPPANAPAN
jgi:Spy/CpxP family protein refolding chaperone